MHIRRVSKNVPPSTCYNLDTHYPITIIFGRSVSEKVRNQTVLLFSHLTYIGLVLLHYLRNKKPRRQAHWCILRAIQLQRYRLPFSWTMPQYSLQLNTLITRVSWVIHQREYESWVKKIEEIKQLVEFRQCTDTALREKCNFRISPFYHVVQKHKLIDMA